jgi:2-haloalkanoic acid dehalogenase type II
MDFSPFTTLTFDCYGTLIDWETGITGALRAWRNRTGLTESDERLLELFGSTEMVEEDKHPDSLYPMILAEVLRRMGRDLRAEPTGAEVEMFSRSVPEWPAFADSQRSLAYLKQHFKLVILSNVDRRSFAGSNRRLGVDFDLVVTAQDVGSYKPDLRNFRRLLTELEAMGVAQEQILHVAQSLRHDIEPANHIGLSTVWVDRRHAKKGFGATAPPSGDATPELRVTSLAELVEIYRGRS